MGIVPVPVEQDGVPLNVYQRTKEADHKPSVVRRSATRGDE